LQSKERNENRKNNQKLLQGERIDLKAKREKKTRNCFREGK
jgi:hypothetical protein